MNGVGQKPGWAWIFILEGLFTFLFGLVSYALLPRSPLHARFLSQQEKEYVVARLMEDGSTSKQETADGFSWREVGMAFILPQVWMLGIIFFFSGKQCAKEICFTAALVSDPPPILGTVLYALA